ncbi:transposase [Xenorhabdus ishibashii]|uniref:Transposase n=1 Tax=Xenorhabdus ishibashii TaxID=1034471 RepID=A0A2D0KF68_9GAMM|nr:transposase [Xenorhabdus ishibashii]PHM62066.1 transposase [Xenorhabdus ishibashii]
MKLKPIKRHYSVEFKLEAVQQVVLHHQRVIDIARSLAVDASMVQRSRTPQKPANVINMTMRYGNEIETDQTPLFR